MQTKLGVTNFVSEITSRVENYLDFEKLTHVIQHGLQNLGKNIEGELTEGSDLNHIL